MLRADPNQQLQKLCVPCCLTCVTSVCYQQALRGSDTGVFIGCMWLEYGELLAAHGAASGAFLVTGNGLAFMAGRVSYAFGFTGPCVPTNTGALNLRPHTAA